MKTELKYGDQVKIKEGFYEGKEGFALHYNNKVYTVRLNLTVGCHVEYKDVEFLEHELEKIEDIK